jgi:hypothetical protein
MTLAKIAEEYGPYSVSEIVGLFGSLSDIERWGCVLAVTCWLARWFGWVT